MNKQEFSDSLKQKLSGLPAQEVEERLSFYCEMIDDRIEEGRTEEEAVAEIGSVDAIAAQIIAEIPLTKIAKERIKPKRQMRPWEIVLLILGSPIWLSLVVAVAVVAFALYAVLWSLVLAVWAVFAAFALCAPFALCVGILLAVEGNGSVGLALVGAALVCAGYAIFVFCGGKAVVKGILWVTKKLAVGVKQCFVKKENVG